jgi:hypothetical protein
MYAWEMYAWEMYAWEMYAWEMYAWEMHAWEILYTLRCTPGKRTPKNYWPIDKMYVQSSTESH